MSAKSDSQTAARPVSGKSPSATVAAILAGNKRWNDEQKALKQKRAAVVRLEKGGEEWQEHELAASKQRRCHQSLIGAFCEIDAGGARMLDPELARSRV